MCATGGFKLTKWTSNSRAVLASVPVDERAKEVKDLDLDKDKLPLERVLGMRWDVESDMFFFSQNKNHPKTTISHPQKHSVCVEFNLQSSGVPSTSPADRKRDTAGPAQATLWMG